MLRRAITVTWLLLAVATPASAVTPARAGDVVGVHVMPELIEQAVVDAERQGATVRYRSDEAGYLLLETAGNSPLLEESISGLREALPTVQLHAAGRAAVREPRDPFYASEQRATSRRVALDLAWARTVGTSNVTIAILDTGVDATHPDLAGRVLQGYDFVNDDANAADDNGHGTLAAGVAAAVTDNAVGIAGTCWKCSILPVKVLDASGAGDPGLVAAGIIYAADRGADVISLSLSGPTGSGLDSAVNYAVARGAVLVAAAGNTGGVTSQSTEPTDPAALAGVIGVAATDLDDRAEDFTREGSWVDVAVPGRLLATFPGGRYDEFVGTSAGTPLVAGVAGLLLSVEPGASAAQVRTALQSGVVQADIDVAYGRLDAAAALSALSANRAAVSAMPTSGTPLRGDWDGDGVDTPGIHLGRTFYLRNSPTSGPADVKLVYGRVGDRPVVGDWDGDGIDTIGVVRNVNGKARFILRNVYRSGADDIVMTYGNASDTPVVGDWDGNGTDTLGVVRNVDGRARFILRNVYRSGADDIVMTYGNASDTPVVGDWDGNGTDTLGVVRNVDGRARFILRNVYRSGADDIVMTYGNASDTPVVGDWDGSGTDTLGVVRGSRWILRSNYGRPYEDRVISN